jgi:hypothetical protein
LGGRSELVIIQSRSGQRLASSQRQDYGARLHASSTSTLS